MENCQLIKICGNNSCYFTFTEFRVENLNKLIDKIKADDQIEFFEIDRCNFDLLAVLKEA